jgi:hypothetical protein
MINQSGCPYAIDAICDAIAAAAAAFLPALQAPP